MPYDFSDFQAKGEQALEHVRKQLSTLRTGRASAQMLDPVVVEVYGGTMKIAEVASVQVPDPSLIMITPWDKNIIENVEKAIASAGLNLSPVVDGDVIRISIPPLTEEKRKEMVKELQRRVEDGRAMLRRLRTDTKQLIEQQKGQGSVSEDDVTNDLKSLEDEHKALNAKLDEMSAAKEKDLMTL